MATIILSRFARRTAKLRMTQSKGVYVVRKFELSTSIPRRSLPSGSIMISLRSSPGYGCRLLPSFVRRRSAQ